MTRNSRFVAALRTCLTATRALGIGRCSFFPKLANLRRIVIQTSVLFLLLYRSGALWEAFLHCTLKVSSNRRNRSLSAERNEALEALETIVLINFLTTTTSLTSSVENRHQACCMIARVSTKGRTECT